MVGRPRTCECDRCPKCRRRAAQARWYAKQTMEKRREIIAARDPEAVRAADRKRSATPKRRADVHRIVLDWRARHPEAVRAHNAVARAIRKGTLVRGPCEECPPGRTGRVHAHHDDYSKPLDVRWLCPRHHAAVTLLRKDNP